MPVESEVRGRVLVVTMQREAKRNAIDQELADGIGAALDRLDDDPDLWVGVLTGTATVFSAGTDLATSRGGSATTDRGGEYGVIRRDRAKPLIAAVEGPALGGGFEIVLACDLVVAADTARFGIPEVQRGLMAAAGALIRLPKRVPLAIALELTMTGDPFSAQRALELGLVNRVVPADDVLDTAVALAERIGENSPVAVRVSRKLVRETLDLTEAQAWERNYELSLEVFSAGDAIEGATAFAEKRPPVWTST